MTVHWDSDFGRRRRRGRAAARRRPGATATRLYPLSAPGLPAAAGRRLGGADFFTAATGRPAVIGHRGSGVGMGPGDARENTLRSMRAAADMGADWIETDVQLSADGDMILAHNPVVDGRWISRMSTRDLLRRGLHTLEEAHEKLPSRLGFDVEIKMTLAEIEPNEERDLFRQAIAWAQEAQQVRPVLLTSFCPTLFTLDCTDVPLGWLTRSFEGYHRSVASAIRMGTAVATVQAKDVLDRGEGLPDPRDVMEYCIRHGLAVLAWGVAPHQVQQLVEYGVTGLCGDDVPALVAAVKKLPELP